MWDRRGMSNANAANGSSAGPTGESGSLQRPDGTRIAWRYVPAVGAAPKALVVVSHGVAEHVGRYAHVIAHLAAAGYAVIAGDHRGHGDSSGKRVFVNRFREYTDDLQAVVEVGKAKSGAKKVALLGHSMGGLIAVGHLLDHPGAVDLAVLSSPGLGIAVAVPKWKDALGRLMSKVWPSLSIPTGIGPELVSRDAAVVQAYASDPKVTKTATARWYTEFLDAQVRAFAEAKRVTLPVVVLTAGKDGLVSPAAQERWFQAIGSSDKTLIPYPELFHEIMNEPEQKVVLGDIVRWLDRHTG